MEIPDMETLEEPEVEESESGLCENCRVVVEKVRAFESWAETTSRIGLWHREEICDAWDRLRDQRCHLCHFLVETWSKRHWAADNVIDQLSEGVTIRATSAAEHIVPESIFTGTERYYDTYSYLLKGRYEWAPEHGFHVAHEKDCSLVTKIRPDTATGSDRPRNITKFVQPKAIKSHVDYQQLRDWNAICRASCVMQHAWLNETPLYLLDCSERVVVSHTDIIPKIGQLEYVALSYVWGSTAAIHRPVEMKIPFTIPDECPKTIEHAITVVKEMGLRYLWVDMYCVSTDFRIKHSLVYKSASFTIIAAFGDCADDGLPGVGPCPRTTQLVRKIGNITFLQRLPNWFDAVRDTTWNSRGWTYQENILSGHKLIFTEFQVYFVCDARPSLEETWELTEKARQLLPSAKTSAKFDVDALLVPSVSVSRLHDNDELEPQDRDTLEESRSGVLNSFNHHVMQYTKRTLTYGTDALSAIQSILDAGADKKVYHLQGIPYVQSSEGNYLNFACGLSWKHSHEDLSDTIRRRLEFPSWSWAAWEAAVFWDPLLESASDIQFWHLDQATGEYCPMESMGKLLDYPHPVRLRIATDVTEISQLEISKQQEATELSPYCEPDQELHFHNCDDFRRAAYADSKDRLLSVFAFRTATNLLPFGQFEFLILITDREDGTWERIGYAKVSIQWWKERKKEPKTFILC
jgi:hypothetical protein